MFRNNFKNTLRTFLSWFCRKHQINKTKSAWTLKTQVLYVGFYCIGGDRLVHVGQREKRLCNKNFFLVFLGLKKKLAVSSLKNATFFFLLFSFNFVQQSCVSARLARFFWTCLSQPYIHQLSPWFSMKMGPHTSCYNYAYL